jgi:ribosomal protein S18 acetylase RimI-like enzyme
MEEIAATFAAAGQPAGFHQAAADVYRAVTPGQRSGSPVSVELLQPADEAAAEALLDAAVAGRRQLRLGEEHDVLALPGFVARVGDALAGVATYGPSGASVELAVLAVADGWRGQGVGAALVEAVTAAAADHGASTLWLVTTNDNLDALRLYQRHGFQLAEVRPGAIDASRRRKPQIPELGQHGIPLRDELVLVRHLGRDTAEADS